MFQKANTYMKLFSWQTVLISKSNCEYAGVQIIYIYIKAVSLSFQFI